MIALADWLAARADLRGVVALRPFVLAAERAGKSLAPADDAPPIERVAFAFFLLLDALLVAVWRARKEGTLDVLCSRLTKLRGELAGPVEAPLVGEASPAPVRECPGLVRFPRTSAIELRGMTAAEHADAGPITFRIAHVQQALADLGRTAARLCTEHPPETDAGRARWVVLKSYRDHLETLGNYPRNVGPDGVEVAAASMILRRPSRALARLRKASTARRAAPRSGGRS
ncbi:MAG: hypothetical protein FJ104_14550 [Deltaproteobacteria bacterium]|nr:hypothetical protein [Deltaproteobacteria bacterium]